MELIWVMWFLFGLFSGVIVSVVNFGMDERERDSDNDMRIYVPSRSRNRGGDNGRDKRMETEEVINGLQTIRMAASRQEKEYIDYACECVAIREKIFDKLIENMKGEKNEERNDSNT